MYRTVTGDGVAVPEASPATASFFSFSSLLNSNLCFGVYVTPYNHYSSNKEVFLFLFLFVPLKALLIYVSIKYYIN